MHTQTARTQGWLAESANIQAEIAALAMPAPAPSSLASGPAI